MQHLSCAVHYTYSTVSDNIIRKVVSCSIYYFKMFTDLATRLATPFTISSTNIRTRTADGSDVTKNHIWKWIVSLYPYIKNSRRRKVPAPHAPILGSVFFNSTYAT